MNAEAQRSDAGGFPVDFDRAQVLAEIDALEAQVGPALVKVTRTATGVPKVDGAPDSWLVRYRDGLRGTARPKPKPVHDLGDFWDDQRRRTGLQKKFQVWAGRGRPIVLLGSTDDQAEAMALCRAAGRTAWVLPAIPPEVRRPGPGGATLDAQPAPDRKLFFYFKAVVRTDRGNTSISSERGEWAPPAPPKKLPGALVRLLEQAKKLAEAEPGTSIRSLGIGLVTARRLIAELAKGAVLWRGRIPYEVPKVKLRLDLARSKPDGTGRKQLVVRRGRK